MRSLTLADIMNRHMAGCDPSCRLARAAAMMTGRALSALLVRENTALLGVVTERDMLAAAHARLSADEPVSAIMSRPVLRAPHDMAFRDAYLHAARHRVRHLAVVDDDGQVIGLASESEFRHHLDLEVLRRLHTVEALVDKRIPTLAADEFLSVALERMNESRATCVMVLEGNLPRGIITMHDVVGLYNREYQAETARVGEVMTSPVNTVSCTTTALQAAEIMQSARLRHLCVLDEQGRYLGVLSEHDLLRPLELVSLDQILDERDSMAATLDEVQSVAGLGSWALDMRSGMLTWSTETYALFGLPEGTPLSLEVFADCLHADDRDRVLAAWQATQDDPLVPYDLEHRILRQNEIRWVHEQARVFRDLNGQPLRAVGTVRDITARKQAQIALEDSEARYRAVVEQMSDTLSVLDRDGKLLYLNAKAAMTLSGGRPEELQGHNISDYLTADDARQFIDRYRQVIDTGEPFQGEIGMRLNGAQRWFLNRLSPLRLPGSGEVLVLSMSLDISQERQADEGLRLAASVFEHAHEGILITDPEQRILRVNDTFCEITGYSREDVIGQRPSMLRSGHHPPDFYQSMWSEIRQSGHWQGELWNRKKNGELFAELLTISAVHSSEGKVVHYLGLFSDITQSKEHHSQLERMAHYDALTQLPNRVLLGDRLQQARPQALRSGKPLAVCYLDLDGFKEINDSLGHAAGDRLLLEVAQRLTGSVRSGDTVARLGGDEFIILLRDYHSYDDINHTLTRVLAVMSAPYGLPGGEARISASIGVTLYPQDDSDPDTLIRHADQAMYAAKLAGRNRFQLFDPEHDRRIRAHRLLLSEVRRGLERREFELHYQPKVDMRRGQVVGVEALIRWRHPQRGLLLPGAFMAALEDVDLAPVLGDWVLGAALCQMEKWRIQGLELTVSVNVAGRHLQESGFARRLREHLSAHPRLAPQSIELEILESAALEDMGRVSGIIRDCHDLGVRIALDDFGTGYASLTYFRRLPVDILKVDQSFVRDMLEDEEDYAIVEGVVGLTQAFRRQVVAEGVESSQHGMVLLRLGCDLAQGFGIAHPMPAELLSDWVQGFRPDPLWHTGLSYSLSRDDLALMVAEHNHRFWIEAVTAYLSGDNPADAQPACVDHYQCAFGRWYYGAGMRRYSAYPEFQALEEWHRQAHDLATELCRLKAMGNSAAAMAGLSELQIIKTKLLHGLDELVEAITEAQIAG